ncbi:MAG: phytoene desaturase family protein [Fibrobacterota bacterium]
MASIGIIGSGLGGLTAGAYLAQQGHTVTLVEQHSKVGGAATTFQRKEFTAEVGLHEINGVFDDPLKKKIFTDLGVYDALHFCRAPEFLRLRGKNVDFTIPDGREAVEKALIRAFPKEQRGIKKYLSTIEKLSKQAGRLRSLRWWMYPLFPFLFMKVLRYRRENVGTFLDRIIASPKLKMILNSNISYYHDDPYQFSLLYHSIAQHSYLCHGGWYITGGSQKLSDHLSKIITDHGGSVITGAEVHTLCRKNKKITGAEYRHRGKEKKLECDIVISNASPESTYAMSGTAFSAPKRCAPSLLTLYLGFSRNLGELRDTDAAYSTFYCGRAQNQEEYGRMIRGSVFERPFVFTDYSRLDAGLAPPGKSFAVITAGDYLQEWQNLTEEEYRRRKDTVITSFLSRLEAAEPGLTKHIEYKELATARTMQNYLRTPAGTAYGYAPDADTFFGRPRPQSEIFENLFFTGAWVIGGGFTPTIASGGLCAKTIATYLNK